MYITAETILEIERGFGRPREEYLDVDMNQAEIDFLKRSRRNGRAHDVTVYTLRGRSVAVIRKPSYPAGLFRAPSGGVEMGEDFVSGVRREAREETGLEIDLERYILRIRAVFRRGGEKIPWTSHVFTAAAPEGSLNPLDTKEIAEARWIDIDELKGEMRGRLLSSPNAGLRYRGELDRLAVEEIERRTVPPE